MRVVSETSSGILHCVQNDLVSLIPSGQGSTHQTDLFNMSHWTPFKENTFVFSLYIEITKDNPKDQLFICISKTINILSRQKTN
jgi:hypothetical protein